MGAASSSDGEARPSHLLRVLGFTFAVAISIGSVIGGGILGAPASVAERISQPWLILLLWVVGGLHALLQANVVAELMTSVPKAGGLYVPTRRAFGDFAGLLVGWTDWLANGAATAALALIFADFMALLAPGAAPYKPGIALASMAALFALNWIGVREGSIAQKIGSLAKCLLLFALIGAIFLFVPAAAPGSAAPAAAAPTLLGMVVAYQLVFGVYSGWMYPIFFVEEDPNAARNIPRALALSILIITATYLAINAALLHALPIDVLRESELPLAPAVAHIFGGASTAIIAAIALVIVASCMNAGVMGLPRILYGLGRDGLFLAAAQRVNRGGTPDIALAISAGLSVLLCLSGTFETVFLLMGALLLFNSIISEVSLFALRRREPGLQRPFRAIGYPWLPVLVILIDTALLVAVLAADPWSGVWMFALIGACVPISILLHHRRRRAAPAA